MSILRPLMIVMAAILMAASPSYGRVKPKPIDMDKFLMEFTTMTSGDVSEEEKNKWLASKSETELATISIIFGTSILKMIEGDVFADDGRYDAYIQCITLIEKGVDAIDKSGEIDALYQTSAGSGSVPVRYILADAYDKAYKYGKADSVYIQTAQEVGRDFGMDSEEFVFWTNQCAESLQRKSKNYEGAIRLLLPAKEAALHSQEVSDSTACDFLASLAQKYQRAGNHNEAKALAIEAEKRTNGDYRRIFNVSGILGELYLIEGEYDTAREYFRKTDEYAPSLSSFFTAGINCANILWRTGFTEDAETVITNVGKYKDSEELSPIDLFNYYESLGVLYTFTNPDKSAEYFKKAEEYIGVVDYPEVVRHVLNSQVYPNEGNGFKIISALDRAEVIYGMFIGNEPRLLNELLFLKGYYLADVNDYKWAGMYVYALYQRMLDYAPGDPDLLKVIRLMIKLDEIAGEDIRRGYYLYKLLQNAKVHGESSDIYMDAVADALHFNLQMRDEERSNRYFDIYSKNRPNRFDTRCFEYRLRNLQGRSIKAEKILDKLAKDFPDERPTVDLMRQRFYQAQRSPKIAQVANDVFANYRSELIRRLLFMSNGERRNVDAELRSRRDEIISALSFAPEMAELALDYSLFSKGLLFHTQSGILRMLADNDSVRMEVAVINGLKAELTRAMNSYDKYQAHNIQKAIDSRERYLIDDFLNRENFGHRFERYSSKSLLARVDSAEQMLDFVEYADSGKTRLMSFIIERNSPVKFVDFGDVSGLDNAQIGKRIWTRLAPWLKTGKTIYFCADGILNAVPIEYAEDEDGMPMCEKYDLHRVFHLSDIRILERDEQAKREGIGNRVEAIGVADHNSPKGQAHGLEDGYRGNWNDLAGVEKELHLIAESLDGAIAYRRSLNDEATEAYVKSLSGQPITTLHIATHGFYRGENELTKAFNDPDDFDHNIARRMLTGNRASVSGLVMRNGNLTWKSEIVTEDEDDILTSEEVETLSFPTLNLTVLSACETGLGDLSADGVWGLQRAFRIAGSGSLICSLRQVKDNGAADFMAEFYHQAATGLSIHKSFYNARKELLLRDPENKEVWSSFILIE